MERIKNLIVFIIIPIVIVLLLWVNGRLAGEKYLAKETDLQQYSANITSDTQEIMMKREELGELEVQVKNMGTMTWIPSDQKDIALSYHLFKEGEDTLHLEGERTRLPHAIRPGESITMYMRLQAPAEPGRYLIVIDMVHEDVTWFRDKGSEPTNIYLEVE